MSESMSKIIRRRASVDKVITALHDFFEEKDSTSSAITFASTRDVADRSELSIYNARHILIKLEKEGVITSTRKENSNSLYWNKTDSFKV
ncbi:FaeA/PapI family transcriptional regulator [Pseudomonas graminis]